ncbi:MAG: hypothetical protein HDR82_05290 [Bacteroides sp.]|nr:hypothetical protein [Bacteroides sp.]
MKKFYTLALAAAVSLAASATAPAQLKTLAPEKKATTSMQRETTVVKMSKVSSKGLSRAGEEESIEGEYEIIIGDYYFDTSVGEFVSEAEIVDNGNGSITISSSDFYNTVKASYDAKTGNITFTSERLGSTTINNKRYYVAFQPTEFVMISEEEGDILYNSYSANFDATTGEISFPADCGFAWVAYSDLAYTKEAGFLDLFDVLGMSKAAPAEPIDEEQAGQWKTIGNATFVDAWVMASFSLVDENDNSTPVNPADFPLEVELQQNVENANIYRLWRPYFSEEFLELVGSNTSKFNGQIVFDVTDPDHVIVKPGLPAGYKSPDGEFYNFDLLGWQIWGFGDEFSANEDLPLIYTFMEQNGQPFSTFKDGVITVNSSNFDFSAKCEKAYSWTKAVTKVSTITFPKGYDNAGISEVEVNDNGEATYYNLQGVRVNDNVKGLVIRVQNGKATKVVL